MSALPENDTAAVVDNGFGYTIELKDTSRRLRRTLSHDPDDAWRMWRVVEMQEAGSTFAEIGQALDMTDDEAVSTYRRVSTFRADTVPADAP